MRNCNRYPIRADSRWRSIALRSRWLRMGEAQGHDGRPARFRVMTEGIHHLSGGIRRLPPVQRTDYTRDWVIGVGRTRKRHRVKRFLLWLVSIILVLCCTSSNSMWIDGPLADLPVRPISNRLFTPGEVAGDVWNALFGGGKPSIADVERLAAPAAAASIAHVAISQHPFMAAGRGNNMHCDAYMSDAYEAAGPVGPHTTVSSRTQGFGGYGTVTFDRLGRIVAVYSNGRGFELELMDPETLEELASYPLPGRPWSWIFEGILPWQYIGAGMYFYLDDQDRAVIPTTKNTIEVVRTPIDGGDFTLVREYDLSEHVVPMRWPHRDSVAWVLPDWGGAFYWYATTGGLVGTVDVTTGAVQTRRLDGEIIENSFAVGEDGVYIVSDHALYRFHQDGGRIEIDWRTAYDRGPGVKPGHITRGSGTSVSLMGDTNGLVVITDNAEPRIHVLFVRRADGTLVCSAPLFEEGKSGTDISAVCFEHADALGVGTGRYSILVENNWGPHRFPTSRPEPGLTRVDLVRREDGTYRCEEVWMNPVRGICVFKLSFGSGLVYTYWRDEDSPITTWVLTGIDFASGRPAFRTLAGTGQGYNNWAGALFVHPDGGVVYSTTIFGLVRFEDEMQTASQDAGGDT
jgi:hypothetical protein